MNHELRRFIERKIGGATLQKSPFPHLVIENFFPNELYEKIMVYNPFLANRGEEWLSAAASNNVTSRTPYHARKQINFHANAAFEARPEAAAFWNDLKSCFLSDPWFEGVVQKKYDEYFQLRFGDLAGEPEFLTYFRKELFLQRHEPGYYIGPHTDIPTRVFTCIFAFASASGFEEYGTELLAPKDPLVRCWGNDHYAPDGFAVKKIAPYSPNNFLLFFKTRQSFHSVKAITDEVPNQRYGMQFQFYEPGSGLFKDLSVPDLMSTKHRTAPPKPHVSWIANSPTSLKKRPAPAAGLSAEDKIAVQPGDVVVSQRQEPNAVGGHCELFGVTLNGLQVGANWFLYSPHWDAREASVSNATSPKRASAGERGDAPIAVG
jgi:hypothetical protein